MTKTRKVEFARTVEMSACPNCGGVNIALIDRNDQAFAQVCLQFEIIDALIDACRSDLRKTN